MGREDGEREGGKREGGEREGGERKGGERGWGEREGRGRKGEKEGKDRWWWGRGFMCMFSLQLSTPRPLSHSSLLTRAIDGPQL